MPKIKQTVHTLWHMQLLRAALFGGVGAVVQTFFFEILGVWSGLLPLSQAVVVGAEFATLITFFLNHHLNFSNTAHVSMWRRLIRFHITVSGSLFIQWVFLFVAERATNDVRILHSVYAAGILIGFVSNYTLYRLWVWRTHHPNDFS